jgi:methionyl-tRNA formyltransferase
MRLAFIATGDIAIPTFRHLIDHGPKPVVLITQPDKPVGRSQSSAVPPEIKNRALAHGIPVWQPDKISEIAKELEMLHVDIGVVMAYGQMIGIAVRKAPKKAMINLHASLLPKYRGASCIQSAIRDGDTETGITIMHVIRELDAGNIISTRKIAITSEDTGGVLHDKLANLGPAALDDALAILNTNPRAGSPQNPQLVTHAPKLLREHGRLDFTQPAELIERTIRAYDPWPGTFTEIPIKGKPKRIKLFPPTTVSDQPHPAGQLLQLDGRLLIGCGGKSLLLYEVQPEGSTRMPASAFANSLR